MLGSVSDTVVVDPAWVHPFYWHPDVVLDLFGCLCNSVNVSEHWLTIKYFKFIITILDNKNYL